MIKKSKYITNNIFEEYIPPGFVSPKQALEKLCEYTYFLGERSNGKTTNVLGYLLGEYIMSKFTRQFVIIRRYNEDILSTNSMDLFKHILSNNYIEKMTGGTFNNIYFYRKRFYLTKVNEEGRRIITYKEPFAFVMSISEQEHKKSTPYPDVYSALFDEVASKTYLTDEFILFMNLLSTIIRLKEDFKVIMCSNTISRFCPYYREMGLYHIQEQKQGTIDVYEYGIDKDKGQIAVYYCEEMPKHMKKSNKFFSFNNPKLQMITSGKWEIGLYPHCPVSYLPKNILFIYFIIFENKIFQCEIIMIQDKINILYFTFIHEKTTPIKNEKDLVFCLDDDNPSIYRRKNILKKYDKISEKILWFYLNNKVYYQDNFVGDSIRNYLIKCKKGEI